MELNNRKLRGEQRERDICVLWFAGHHILHRISLLNEKRLFGLIDKSKANCNETVNASNQNYFYSHIHYSLYIYIYLYIAIQYKHYNSYRRYLCIWLTIVNGLMHTNGKEIKVKFVAFGKCLVVILFFSPSSSFAIAIVINSF